MNIPLNPQRGFRDIYPSERIYQDYVFKTLKNVASLYGFESYDGPILEDVQIYLNKTSAELIERQTFQVKDKKEKTLVLRPEMTPTLARMVAKKAGATTISITNYAKSPIDRVSDIKLTTVSKETSYRTEGTASRIAELCIIDALFVGVGLKRAGEIVTNIQKTRQAVVAKHY